MKKKYCCEEFKWRHETERTMGINIRIIKLQKEDVFNFKFLSYPYRIYLTEGYEKGQKNVKSIAINFCPFCGRNVKKYYRTDDFINENNHDFLLFA